MSDQDPRDARAGLPTLPQPVFRPTKAPAEDSAIEEPREPLKRSAAHVCARGAARMLGLAAPALAREVCAQMTNHLAAFFATLDSVEEDAQRRNGPERNALVVDVTTLRDFGRAILELVNAMRPA